MASFYLLSCEAMMDLRYCYFCRKDTDTVDERCVVCALSKPHRDENTPEKRNANGG